MTHGVSFIDEHRHDPHRGRRTAPTTGRTSMLRTGLVGVLQVAGVGYRSR
ncbi:hypothetical protein HNR22_001017 [Micromonospora jinlongensis]|uniref:Uncharacterized protein n=1 Tax=Micromonospora jinlongensis TaxID=1287877 RepID=A0A7Z0BCZ2_9ACTN|nr:hypothetical protein [Micromonospora jinlongensis]NYH41290.1 hypothetical protein [Micromonospora jinlongensis]